MSHDNVFALKNPAVPNEVRDALTVGAARGSADVAGAGDRSWADFLRRSHDQPMTDGLFSVALRTSTFR